MDVNFDMAFKFAMLFEGYKSEDPDDSGGRTIYGISAKSHPQTVAALWGLPKEEALIQAKEFYRTEYWLASGCDTLPWPEDVVVFDAAVNMGISRAMQFKVASKSPFDFLMRRISFYIAISAGKNIKFLRGWIRRVLELYKNIK